MTQLELCRHKDLYKWTRYFNYDKESIRAQCRDCGVWVFYTLTFEKAGKPPINGVINAS